MRYTTRPLSDRAWLRPDGQRNPSQFKVTWSQALELLERELDMIDGTELVIEIDVREQDLRLDGMLRANARADQPAVIVAFESKHGPLLYRSDQYSGSPYWRRSMEDWQHNVYAVAKTLEALRAVDRYGAARSGEQYRGYRQIEAPTATSSITRLDAAEAIALAAYPGHDLFAARPDAVKELLAGEDTADVIIRRARRYTHPDAGGSTAAFQAVQDAIAVLGGAR